tara:strand:- start:6342 stop:7664 length:1323 start_codon:yes stop_codon:yes gene_type:complete
MIRNILIIGSGFNALATAHFLKSKNNDVKIIFEKSLKGVLGSVEVEEEKFDLGYQFFDGLDKETEKFIRNMFLNEDLHNFKYGASTYTNNFLYKDHAIPYWISYGKIFVVKAFLFYLKNFFKSFFIKDKMNTSKLSDLYIDLPPNIRDIIMRACEKHYQIKPNELETVANEMSTFTNFRQTLFNDYISNFLKKNSKFFDKHLASRRKSNNHLENISLYPIKKNMEYITDKLINNLNDNGVVIEQCNFDKVNLIYNDNKITLNDEKFDQVIITTNLGNAQRLFKLGLEKNYEHYISQVFIYFTLPNLNFEFQYTQINDLNLYCSRISNCSLYSRITSKDNHVLIAEIPLTSNDILWNDDDKLIDIAWNEINRCGIVEKDLKFLTAKVLKIPKTFPVPKINFFDFLKELEININEKFSGKVKLIGQGIFTRHKFIKELLNKF